MSNKVIAGDYLNQKIIIESGKAHIKLDFGKKLKLSLNTVESYDIVNEQYKKSIISGALRGAIGGSLLGPAGLLAGGLSAKNKGLHQVIIQFKDGKKSLVELDDKTYKAFLKGCF